MVDGAGYFGDDRWKIWRVNTTPNDAVHFTVYKNDHLDCHAEIYANRKVEEFFSPYQKELINLYYEYVHPSYPILSGKDEFLEVRSSGRMPNSLLAAVFIHGAIFWQCSSNLQSLDCPDHLQLRPYIFSSLSLEARTPNLAVIQAALLFMQLPPQCIRAPNHPGFWAMTSMVVAMAQDTGLYRDPSSWTIPIAERKLRRLLWWAVYMHDKWMAHWLGRPSHINDNHYDVKPLTLDDFSNDQGMMNVDSISFSKSFIAMAELSTILSTLLETFHTCRPQPVNVDLMATAVSSDSLHSRLQLWKQHNGISPILPENESRAFTVALAGYTVELSIHRAVLGTTTPGSDSSTAAQVINVLESLCQLLEDLRTYGKRAFWLSYNKGSLAVAGSLAITLVLSNTDDYALPIRRKLLVRFRALMAKLAGDDREFEFARLPLRRLNLFLEDMFGPNYGDDLNIAHGGLYDFQNGLISSSSVEAAMEEMIWANYTIPM